MYRLDSKSDLPIDLSRTRREKQLFPTDYNEEKEDEEEEEDEKISRRRTIVSTSFLIRNILGVQSTPAAEPLRAVDFVSSNQRVALPRGESVNLEDYLPKVQDASESDQCNDAKLRRGRTMFSNWQLGCLEWRFERNKYLTTSDRLKLAQNLQLDQLQVKTWFQVSIFEVLLSVRLIR